jgi:hypothetical protein
MMLVEVLHLQGWMLAGAHELHCRVVRAVDYCPSATLMMTSALTA